MNVGTSNYKTHIETIATVNVNDTNLQNFDISWADFDVHNEINPSIQNIDGPISKDAWTHKIGYRTWDIIPGEKYECDHEFCNDRIIYKYNNEYYRCDDFNNSHNGTHILFGGCSESEGVGGRLETTWTKMVHDKISEKIKTSGFYSIARAGFGWQKIITNFQIYGDKYGFPEYFFVLLPNVGRQYKYSLETEHYQYYQTYPEDYSIDENGLCTTITGKKIPVNKLHEEGIIPVEDYFKSLIDFKVTWKLFENFCESKGTKILWSTYDTYDAYNFEKLNMGGGFFKIDESKINEFISNQQNISVEKDSFTYRDGHFGSFVKMYWAELFLKEIQNRKLMVI